MKNNSVVALAVGCLVCFAALAWGQETPGGLIDAKKTFGLIGDGKADDTKALKEALWSRQPIFIPKGTYRFTQPLRVRSGARIHGGGGGWNPQGQTTFLYDGPKGGKAITFLNAHFAQMRQVNVNANRKAAIGIYWQYSANEAGLEDVAVVGALEHGFYITRTWYARFNRLVVRDCLGSGITIDRKHFTNYAKGPVNDVTFSQCRSSSNGEDDMYDGEKVFDVGYGVGLFGYHTAVNFIACSFEGNGGAGVYIQDGQNHVSFRDCYFEQNAQASVRKAMKLYSGGKRLGEAHYDKAEPTGRWASIIANTSGHQFGTLFDNCYIHGSNGIWLRGADAGQKIMFRLMGHPSVIWSEHGRWELVDSTAPPLAAAAGLIVRTKSSGDRWMLPKGVKPTPGGHPGHAVTDGVRRVYPAPAGGLELFVDTDAGSDANDGRTAERAWKSLAKAVGMFSHTTLDTPCTIHLRGAAPAAFELRGVKGSGRLVLKCDTAATLKRGLLVDTACRFEIDGGDKLVARKLRIVNSANIHLNKMTFEAGDAEGALIATGGGSHVAVSACRLAASGDGRKATGIAADSGARIYITGSRPSGLKLDVMAASGAEVKITAADFEHWTNLATPGGRVTFVE